MKILNDKQIKMINKILVFGGLALSAILVVENMVVPNTAYFFVNNSSTAWFVALVSTMIGVAIGIGISGMRNGSNNSDDDHIDF